MQWQRPRKGRLHEIYESDKDKDTEDILDEMGIDLDELSAENIKAIKEEINGKYAKELEFLSNLPTMLAVGNFIFVHGGIPTDKLETLAGEEAFCFLKLDKFMEQDVCFEKTVVVLFIGKVRYQV